MDRIVLAAAVVSFFLAASGCLQDGKAPGTDFAAPPQLSASASPTPAAPSAVAPFEESKACNATDDCVLRVCTGCYSKEWAEWARTAYPDLPCMQYQGRSCACIAGQCSLQ